MKVEIKNSVLVVNGGKMIGKVFFYCVMVCVVPVLAASARRHRRPRSALDTRLMDIARSAFSSLATDKGLKQNNKFQRAIDEIEKALASMQARRGVFRFNDKEARDFMKILQRAAKSGNIESFREVLGRAIFHNLNLKSLRKLRTGVVSRGEETKALLEGAKAFLSDIKQQIGEEHFEELISINGEVIIVKVS